MIARRIGRLAVWFALLLLLSPLVYACWLSIAPDEFLTPPLRNWSLRWYEEFFHTPRWTAALGESLTVGALAVVFSLVAGLPLAFAVSRFHFRGHSLLMGGTVLPLVTPPILLAIGLLPVMQTLGLWGTSLSLALTHALFGMPMVCWLTRAALVGVDPNLESAARGLGAKPWQVIYRVTLPSIGPSILAGALMAFVLSLNEFLLSLFLATPETETLPRVLWPSLRYSLSPLVAVASCVTTLATSAGIGAAVWLLWRR
jgi:ABC-type spermidine/putrescine transport system permease subunit II